MRAAGFSQKSSIQGKVSLRKKARHFLTRKKDLTQRKRMPHEHKSKTGVMQLWAKEHLEVSRAKEEISARLFTSDLKP